METTIVLIGTGALGTRHLQSLLDLKQSCRIYAVDQATESLEKAKNLLRDRITVCGHSIIFSDDYAKLPKHIDLLIIATNADVRRAVLEQAAERSDIKYLILEKVLFQKPEDYEAIMKLLNLKNIKAWVNCIRREWEAYIALREKTISAARLHLTVSGSTWGMGCNTVHYLDLVQFLSGKTIDKIDIAGLDGVITESKRKGFREINGTIAGNAGINTSFTLTSHADGNAPLLIHVESENLNCVIRENEQKMFISQKMTDWKWEEREFPVPYQSQLTSLLAEKLLWDGTTELPTYGEAANTHLLFINPLLQYFQNLGMGGNICPIT